MAHRCRTGKGSPYFSDGLIRHINSGITKNHSSPAFLPKAHAEWMSGRSKESAINGWEVSQGDGIPSKGLVVCRIN